MARQQEQNLPIYQKQPLLLEKYKYSVAVQTLPMWKLESIRSAKRFVHCASAFRTSECWLDKNNYREHNQKTKAGELVMHVFIAR